MTICFGTKINPVKINPLSVMRQKCIKCYESHDTKMSQLMALIVLPLQWRVRVTVWIKIDVTVTSADFDRVTSQRVVKQNVTMPISAIRQGIAMMYCIWWNSQTVLLFYLLTVCLTKGKVLFLYIIITFIKIMVVTMLLRPLRVCWGSDVSRPSSSLSSS